MVIAREGLAQSKTRPLTVVRSRKPAKPAPSTRATPAWKVLIPEKPVGFVDRPRVSRVLDGALAHRLTTIVAGPGFGKTVALASWEAAKARVWYSVGAEDARLAAFARGIIAALRLHLPTLANELRSAARAVGATASDEAAQAEAFAALLCETLHERLTEDLVLVIDDVHELGPETPGAQLLAGLCRHAPAKLHIVMSSRNEPPFLVQRLRGRGQVLDIDASLLVMSEPEVSELLAALGQANDDVAAKLYEITDGWPATVRLAAEMLLTVPPEQHGRVLESASRPDGPLYAYLAEEVLDAEPPEVCDLLRAAANLERFTPDLCDALGLGRASDALAGFARRGLFVEPAIGPGTWFRLGTLMREFIAARFPLSEEDERCIHLLAAAWFGSHGHLADALASLRAARDPEALARFLQENGPALFDAGLGRDLVAAAETIPQRLRSAELELWAGQAMHAEGDLEGALVCFGRAAGDAEELPAGLAWRIGHIHYMRGEPDRAMDAYRRGRLEDETTADEALLLSWTATLHWMHGDAATCRAVAERAYNAAVASGDARALATAHTTLAMLACLEGDRRANDAHYLQALEAAERAGDLFQMVRIRTNRASHLYEEGWFEQARGELDIAIRHAEVAGFTSLLPLALSNRGWTSYYRGRLEEAVADFDRSRALYQRLDSRKIAYALEGLGVVATERGDLALARTYLEEAVSQSEQARDMQGLVPSMAALARVVAADDPTGAQKLSQRAIDFGPGFGCVAALLAGGWVALVAGDAPRARELADSAAKVARERRDRVGIAEALELQTLSAPAEHQNLGLIEEAARCWREMGSAIGEARAELILSRLSSRGTDRARGEAAERRLAGLGVRIHAAAAGPLRVLPPAADSALAIRSLGVFQVIRDGAPVQTSEWQSRKTRDLLKILVARRGGPVHRDKLIDVLWPDEDPADVANRLSIALSRARGVLDPGRRNEGEAHIVAEDAAVSLDLSVLEIDVERFLVNAQQGLDLLRAGRTDEAVSILECAEELYAGDFLEEDAYEEWAQPVREEARAAYIAVSRGLAAAASGRGEYDAAIRYFFLVLERDPYDEEAHLGLVNTAIAAGRHGEARRYYRAYATRMDEIAIEAAPFPSNGRH